MKYLNHCIVFSYISHSILAFSQNCVCGRADVTPTSPCFMLSTTVMTIFTIYFSYFLKVCPQFSAIFGKMPWSCVTEYQLSDFFFSIRSYYYAYY